MRSIKIFIMLFFILGILIPVSFTSSALNRPATAVQSRQDRFSHNGLIDDEGSPGDRASITEAPTGFDNQTNGFNEQGWLSKI